MEEKLNNDTKSANVANNDLGQVTNETNSVRKCPACGTDIRETDLFCAKCGNRTDGSSISETTVDNINTMSADKQNISKKKINKNILLIAATVAVVVVVALIIVIIILFSNGSNKTNEVIESTTEAVIETEFENDYGISEVSKIGSRTVDYNSSTDEFRVFFDLVDANGNLTSSEGYADISIVNDNSETVYEKCIEFTEDNFTEWTNSYWDERHYMACIYIPRSDITPGTVQTGTLSLAVTCSDGEVYFEPYQIKIYNDLPISEVSITLPELPVTLKQLDYNGNFKNQMTVKAIDYTITNLMDGEATIEFSLTVSLDKSSADSESYSEFTYKLYDSSDVVVDSGIVLNNPVSVGESTVSKVYVFNLIPGENYKLVLDDSE